VNRPGAVKERRSGAGGLLKFGEEDQQRSPEADHFGLVRDIPFRDGANTFWAEIVTNQAVHASSSLTAFLYMRRFHACRLQCSRLPVDADDHRTFVSISSSHRIFLYPSSAMAFSSSVFASDDPTTSGGAVAKTDAAQHAHRPKVLHRPSALSDCNP
jgi:hypothetical protein